MKVARQQQLPAIAKKQRIEQAEWQAVVRAAETTAQADAQISRTLNALYLFMFLRQLKKQIHADKLLQNDKFGTYFPLIPRVS